MGRISTPAVYGERASGTAAGRHEDAALSAETLVGQGIQVAASGCWLWKGRADKYGRTHVNGIAVTIHRFVYETLVGPIPDGDHLHHECETPGCCNPEHLRPLTPKEHVAAHRSRGRR